MTDPIADEAFTPGPQPGATTIDENQFAALTNLMYAILGGWADTPERCGDILYRHDNPMVDDESRMLARVLCAYFGLRFGGGQPVHPPDSGCIYADPAGNCDFHDPRHASAIVDDIAAQMAVGRHTPDGDQPA